MKHISIILLPLIVLSACTASLPATPDLSESFNATPTAPAAETATAYPTTALILPTATGVPGLTVSLLQNAEYTSPDWGTFQLSNGIYYRTPPTSQESPEAYTSRMLDTVLFGDLDQNGTEDALVFLATQTGGTGHFVEMAAVLNQNGSPNNVSTVYLGDRVSIESGVIQDGLITLNMRVQGPDDPMCCPNQFVTWTFRLENNQFVKIK